MTCESRDEGNFIYIRNSDGTRMEKVQLPTGLFIPHLALDESNGVIGCAAGNWVYFYTMDGKPAGELKLSPGRIGGLDICRLSDA